ncbi:hypothetical protein T4B_9308 [Trichinella pseudospiralis]|uniref:Jerky-like protein-like n=1 Tax=Trichinella pseudospiralis TaxID=6337 RepID=A0A0V1E4R9_TRIPS|nr:hypothetical protein T4E_2358 [Trichinella pseudospiralis]KRY68799.1 hypothetical protein T4A_12081 [Trichinella pseudospiralis]KRZ22695.1 hypothetical protein T4B_9308 [Trichinella pseudospiralis]KRZ35353.1 hypothetical protein T4C_3455 [Trichinella pseudospiralis]
MIGLQKLPVVYDYQPKAWMTGDVFPARYKKELLRRIILSDADKDDLVSLLRNVNLKDCCYMIVQATQSNGKDKNEDVDVSDKPDKDVSHLEAYFCSEVGLKWMKQQEEFSATQLMRHIRNVAAQKKLSSFKQKLITDYMEYNAKIPGAFRTYR